MTNQQIIQKFNLKKTDLSHGESVRNGETIYLWPNLLRGYKSFLVLNETGNDQCLLVSGNGEFDTEIVIKYDMLEDHDKEVMTTILARVIEYNKAGH
jgi:hypothetical protein